MWEVLIIKFEIHTNIAWQLQPLARFKYLLSVICLHLIDTYIKALLSQLIPLIKCFKFQHKFLDISLWGCLSEASESLEAENNLNEISLHQKFFEDKELLYDLVEGFLHVSSTLPSEQEKISRWNASISIFFEVTQKSEIILINCDEGRELMRHVIMFSIESI